MKIWTQNQYRLSLILILNLMLVLSTAPQASAAPRKTKGPKSAVGQACKQNAKEIYTQLLAAKDKDQLNEIATKAQLLLLQTTAYVSDSELAILRDIVFIQKLADHMSKVSPEVFERILPVLKKNPAFAYALVYQIQKEDQLEQVYRNAIILGKRFGKTLNEFANLGAAACVVHDMPVIHRINENSTTAEPVERIFGYYSKNNRKMRYDLRKMPVDLLVFVVDNAVSTKEMYWALDNYQGHRQVGLLFFTIEYDMDHFRRGAKKKVTEFGWNLPNIKTYGGICADQAYFSVAVGKSIGVPACYTYGQSGSMAHAWVGYLRTKGRQSAWDFNSGRYKEYQGVLGQTKNPQTGRMIPDSYVGLRAEMMSNTNYEREMSDALCHAAKIFAGGEKLQKVWDELTPPVLKVSQASDQKTAPQKIRKLAFEDAQELLVLSIKHCYANTQAWEQIGHWAKRGKLKYEDKASWATSLSRFCGKKYPDFTLEMLRPMIRSIKDTNKQSRHWGSAIKIFTKRKDLAAAVLVEQGDMWAKANNKKRAGKAYYEVLRRFPNAGPFVISALNKAEGQLRGSKNSTAKIAEMYRRAWSSIKKPRATIGANQSNWYRVGTIYARKLRSAGRSREAQQVELELKEVVVERRKDDN